VSKLTGSYVDPARSRVTVGEWADRWLAGQAHLKPTTRERYAGIVRKHIRPRWGTTRIADVTHADVQGWVTKLSRNAEPATVRKIHRVLTRSDAGAPRHRLTRDPRRRHQAAQTAVARTAVPHPRAGARTGPRRRWPVQPEQAPTPRRAPHEYRLIVLSLAYTGVRFGEMSALRVPTYRASQR
jgi:Phage integrase, N-terminal SAM-like domain